MLAFPDLVRLHHWVGVSWPVRKPQIVCVREMFLIFRVIEDKFCDAALMQHTKPKHENQIEVMPLPACLV